MCGIAGFLGPGTRENLEKMTRVLSHRGPDGEGFYMEEDVVGLGHRRLSIIDLSLGNQPMKSSSGKSVIVFNGEIYNFKALRNELEKNGFVFKTNSDTEVILNGYEKWGIEIVKKLDGMFAFALWDKQKKEIFLARDRFGKKPLYFSQFGNNFIFGSELKALEQFLGFKKEIDQNSLAKYLIYDFVPSSHSIFKNVQKLDGGHFLVANAKSFKIEKYFDPTFDYQKFVVPRKINFNQVQEIFLDLFEKAVEKRLVADVPLGVFLSGGIDSSSVAAMAQKISGQKIKTFSIGFYEKEFDESKYAREVAKKIGSEHYEKIFSFEDALNLVDKIPQIADEPLADASILPTHLLSSFARENVKVALGGDGGDELLLGYPTFSAEKIFQMMRFLPKSLIKKTIEYFTQILKVDDGYMGLDFRLRQFAKGLENKIYGHAGRRHQTWLGSFDINEAQEILGLEICRGVVWEGVFEDVLEPRLNENNFTYLSRLYLKRYLQDEVMVKVDRASMSVGLETRAPFLDTELALFLLNLPTEHKMRGFSGKYLLKSSMKKYLPTSVISRKKKGFGIPLDRWINDELRDKINDTLLSNNFIGQGLLDRRLVAKILDDHYAKKINNRKKIWNLFVLALWFESIK